MNPLKKALLFATNAHTDQYRKNNAPYIVHPVAVALAASQHGLPIEVQQAALLHDVLEDTGVSKEGLEQEFGPYVTGLVVELTNPSHSDEHAEKPRAERKRIDREHLAKVSTYAKMLKMLDRIDNLQDIGAFNSRFQRTYIHESQELFKVLQNANWAIANEFMSEIINAEKNLNVR
jgi:(p)ppGpp synthase/HD superfamily hydrolase